MIRNTYKSTECYLDIDTINGISFTILNSGIHHVPLSPVFGGIQQWTQSKKKNLFTHLLPI